MFTITELTHAKKLEAQIKDLQKQLDSIRDPMKKYMVDNGLKEKTVGQYVVKLVSYERETASAAKIKEIAPELVPELITTTTVNSLKF